MPSCDGRGARILVAIAAALAAGAPHADEPTGFVAISDVRMATRIDAVLPDGPTAQADAARVFAVFAEVEASANEWREGTPLTRVNRAAGGDPVPVPDDLRALLHRGVEAGAATDGAFDVTWAALWGLWDFGGSHPSVPDPPAVAARLPLVDYRRVEIDDVRGTVRLPEPGMAIGLGGIAKGWALDHAAAALRERGVHDFTLSAGGQVWAEGTRGGRAWRVGLRDPRGPRDDAFALVEVRDASVSTSGDYEHFFEQAGTRYHHVLDPRTGWPSAGTRSASVVCADATLADALSTAVMVLGWERGLAAATRVGAEAVVVDAAGDVHITPGLADRLVHLHPPRR